MKILLQICRVLGARLHPSSPRLYSIHPFETVINNDERTFIIWFHLSLLESLSKDKISLAKSPWFDEFLRLMRGSAMVPSHSDSYSLSFLLKLVQSLRELGGVTSAKRFEPGFNGDQFLSSKCENVWVFPNRMFWSCAIGPERYK